MGVNVEIKNSDGEPGFDDTGRLAREVVNAIDGTRADVTVLVSCFDLATLDVVKAAAPELPTGFLTFSSEEPEDFIAVCVERGHQAVNPYDIFVTEASIARAHEHGIEVNVWTVDDPERIAELGSWGVDSVITNRPDVALRALGRGLPDPGSVPA